MDYNRQSSQPATVDLVRADLAEIWTVDDPAARSPGMLPSVSDASEMLDLEFLSTPGCRPSKAPKKDPLHDMLADFLELTPSGKSETKRTHREAAADTNSSESKSNGWAKHDEVSPQPELSPRDGLRGTKPTKHGGTNAQPDTGSPKSAVVPRKGRQRQSNGKSPPSSTVKNGTQKRPRAKRTATKTTSSAPSQRRVKVRGRDEDLFDLSDATDSEIEQRPKKRQAKQQKAREPPPSSTSQTRVPDETRASPINPTSKPRRVPKKASNRPVPRQRKESADMPLQVDEETEAHPISSKTGSEARSAVARARTSPANEESKVVISLLSDLPEEDPSDDFTPPVVLDVSSGSLEEQLASSARSEPHKIVAPSNKRAGTEIEPAGSTSPMFMDQDQDHMSSDEAPMAAAITTALNPDQQWPVPASDHHQNLDFTPQPSFQPKNPITGAGVIDLRIPNHELPLGIREAFLSDESPATALSSPKSAMRSCSEDEDLNPEDVWRQAVDNDAPPAVLRRMISLLHRSLMTREEVVRDIARQYQENGLQLLNTLTARHIQERGNALQALREASHTVLSVFSDAGQDVTTLIDRLRDVAVGHHGQGTLHHPALTQKLDEMLRACQERLYGHVWYAPSLAAASAEEGAASGLKDGAEKLDELAETYRTRLLDAVRQPDDQAHPDYDKVVLWVDGFIQRCLQGETNKAPFTVATVPPKRTVTRAEDALDVLLVEMMDRLEGKGHGDGACGNISGIADIVASEDSDMAGVV